jgi:hypothetical protein
MAVQAGGIVVEREISGKIARAPSLAGAFNDGGEIGHVLPPKRMRERISSA